MDKKLKIDLLHVDYMPRQLEPKILYVCQQFNVAGHLCPCGCATKIITPLGRTEWSFSERDGKPSLYPSIGSWQLPCRSHYWITAGLIEWSYPWTETQIEQGRKAEEKARNKYYRVKRGKERLKIVVNGILSFWKRIFPAYNR